MGESLVDRPLRSVFVGNIPYEVTEEKLREIFSEVGEVLSLKLVFDRETGKPKGYGFCEYKDVQTAMSAMRNLNGFEIGGRILRVDNAGAERQRMAEMGGGGGRDRDMGHHNGPRHGNNEEISMREEGPPPPEKAPEMISRAVAALPPEQMFDLMKQMKLCIQNNPQEARTMLLQNPQLSYALLQALVVMKVIDPSTAISMLHKDNQVAMGSLLPEGQINNTMMQGGFGQPPPTTENPWIAAAAASAGVPLMTPNPPGPFAPPPVPPVSVSVSVPVGGDLDLRQLDPRLRSQGGGGGPDFDLRDPRGQSSGDRGGFSMDPRSRDRDLRDRDMRMSDRDLRDPRSDGRDLRDRDLRDPRMFGSGSSGSSMPPSTTSASTTATPSPLDPRASRRGAGSGGGNSSSSSGGGSNAQDRSSDIVAANKAAMNAFSGMAGFGPGATDKEKASLIMQVLQLSDEQINLLPAEQRQSILTLKEQIAKSTSQGR